MEPYRPEARAEIAGLDGRSPVRRRHRFRGEGGVVAVVAAGGALGAGARYGASLLWPTAPGAFPWTTLAVNVTGCAIMGIVMVLASEMWWRHHLLRPFVGTGILGGYTTFSAYAADIHRLVDAQRLATAPSYLALTVTAALTATWATAGITQRIVKRKTA